jgi:hypothetical protein
MINTAIKGSWIGYASGMGSKYYEYKATESSQIHTMRDLRIALKQLVPRERPVAVYFVTGYARDVLYPQVMWGVTHQSTVEDYVMDKLNASFSIAQSEMKAGHNTCVGQLYSQLFNQKKQKLHQCVQPANNFWQWRERGSQPKEIGGGRRLSTLYTQPKQT